MIPDFEKEIRDAQGTRYLPPGVYEATWEEFWKHFSNSWRRIILLRNLLRMLQHLRDAGCVPVKIDGSFVTSKLEPHDFDGTWDRTGVDVTPKLDESIFRMNGITMYKKYMGELYRQDAIEASTGRSFDEFFQVDRMENRKGIVKINLETLP